MERERYKSLIAEMYNANCTHDKMVQETIKCYPELTYTSASGRMRHTLDILSGEGKIQRRSNGKRTCQTTVVKNTEPLNTNKFPQSVSFKDGATTIEKVVALMDNELITPTTIMRAHGMDSSLWEVLSYKSNYWQSQVQGGKTIDLYQTKLTVKPKNQIELTIDDIDKYFMTHDNSIPYERLTVPEYETDGDTLVIKVPDLHIGLLAWRNECGEDYDLKIAKSNFLSCITDVRRRCEEKPLKKIIIVTLGDVLHTDNDKQTTEHGTFQQTDGRLGKIIECAESMLVQAIEMLKEVAPIKYIYTSGNHDRFTGYMLAKMIENRYLNDENIEFDTAQNPFKRELIGNTLCCFHHGDAPKKNIDECVYTQCKDLISYAKWIEINVGHLHELHTYYKDGVQVRRMPPLCNSSYWEHQQLYSGDNRCMVCDIYNDELGRMETWQSNL